VELKKLIITTVAI
jgi:hypothetical protein